MKNSPKFSISFTVQQLSVGNIPLSIYEFRSRILKFGTFKSIKIFTNFNPKIASHGDIISLG